jgi:NagD protein
MYDAYIFDLDGTIYLGDALLPGAAALIGRIRDAGRRTLFLSNNPTRSRAQYAEKLSRLGIATPAQDIVNSSFVMVEWLLRHAPGARLFVVGEQALHDELEAAGFELATTAEGVDIVVASFDRTFAYWKLQVAFDAICTGARLVATNGDRYCPVPRGGQPDAAAVIAAIEACTGVRCDPIVGKPSPIMVETIRAMLGAPPERCIVVGDRLETDIAMGVAAGMHTALVLTGASTLADLEQSPVRPTYMLQRIDELLKF